MKGYKDLKINQLLFQLLVEKYFFSMMVSNADKFETKAQTRRISQTTKNSMIEGPVGKQPKAGFNKYLVYSHSACLGSVSQAEFLNEVHSQKGWGVVSEKFEASSKKIYNSTKYVETNWKA